MPVPPKPMDPGRVIDPSRHGDSGAVKPPETRNGQPVTQKPLSDHNGRIIAPTQNNITVINNTTVVNNITNVQNNWHGRNDHGYGWYNWNGYNVCHHYDTWGFHWWGFYVGDAYFWARWYNDNYWWYDPYYHRWVYLRDGRWWWQGPDRVVYIIVDDNYYRYRDSDGTVIVTPDPTPPVEVPPTAPTPAPRPQPQPEQPQPTFYSQDGTRSVQILGDKKEAYLYDLTVTDANDARARGRWLAPGIASVKFSYDDKTGADGSSVQVIRQIQLTFEESGATAVTDPNGERKIVTSGDSRDAYLYNLKDDGVPAVYLGGGATQVRLINEETQEAGETIQRLKMIVLSVKDETGAEKTLLFDREGAPIGAGVQQFAPQLPAAARTDSVKALHQRMAGSEAFQALNADALSW